MPDARPNHRPPSAAAAYLVLFAIGLLVGIVLVVVLLRMFEARQSWEDRYPGALMQLYQAQMAQLSTDLDAKRCAAQDTQMHLQTLRALSNDLEPAFVDLRDHRSFLGHAADMRQTLDTSLAAPPVECDGLRVTIDRISERCAACHQDMQT